MPRKGRVPKREVLPDPVYGNVVVAKLIGCVLPMVANKIGFDPAVMSSPFITTIVDALTLLIYFNLAVAILHIA